MTGEGIVVSVSENETVVRISKASACSHDCSECAGCSNPVYDMAVKNPIGAQPGDKVMIEASSGKVLGLAFLLYILPVFFMIAAITVAGAYSNDIRIVLAAAFTVVALWLLIIKKANVKMKMQNTIVKIISPKRIDADEKN